MVNIEREVCDIAISTFSAILLFMINLGPASELRLFLIISQTLIILLNFFHMISRQLNWLTDQTSMWVLIVNFILILGSAILFAIYNPHNHTGFWDFISLSFINSYKFVALVLYLLMLGFTVLGREAKLIE